MKIKNTLRELLLGDSPSGIFLFFIIKVDDFKYVIKVRNTHSSRCRWLCGAVVNVLTVVTNVLQFTGSDVIISSSYLRIASSYRALSISNQIYKDFLCFIL